METLGNPTILQRHKTAFLCSRRIPAAAVLRCYDWAIAQRDAGRCVMSGFHSQLEKDVFYYLLKGTQPIILVLARGMKTVIEPDLRAAVDAGRLLIVSPFEPTAKRVTARAAEIRNRYMVQLADEIVVGYANKEGSLQGVLGEVLGHKPITHLTQAMSPEP